MNYERGLKRVYSVLSFFWILFWLFIGFSDKDIISILIGLIFPAVVYFVLDWIIKGFKN